MIANDNNGRVLHLISIFLNGIGQDTISFIDAYAIVLELLVYIDRTCVTLSHWIIEASTLSNSRQIWTIWILYP